MARTGILTMSRTTMLSRETAWRDCRGSCFSRRILYLRRCPIRLFAGGRIFFLSGHIAFHEREEPRLNTLTALNAYNGLRLWSRPLNADYVVHNVSKLVTGSEAVFAEGGTL